MKVLTIVGNGFDLGHGLLTRFDDFINSNPELYCGKYGFFSDENGNWSDVELKYEKLLRETMESRNWQDLTDEVDRILTDYGLNDYGEVDFYNYDFEAYDEELDKISDLIELLEKFEKDFMSYLRICCNDERVRALDRKKGITEVLEQSDCIITFNYTHTVEVLYGCHGVIHIHGDIDDSIAIGSGALEDAKNSTIDYEYPRREHFSNDKDGLIEWMKYCTEDMDGHLVEDPVIRRFFADVAAVAAEKEEELFARLDIKSKDSLAERQDVIDLLKSQHFGVVYIIGHSLGNADFSVLNAINKDAHVVYFYHSDGEERIRREHVLKELGVEFEMRSDKIIYA